ncbi:MAG TPA: hypothetical protein VFK41_01995 [Nocardioidaceae bacterium]|nr:hypothetical protein [Nocardioidaceae bacterium]
MRRSVPISMMVLGLGLTVSSVGGVIAAFTDEALVGPNSFESKALPLANDLKLANSANGSCGTFGDDLTTGLYSVSDLEPNAAAQFGSLYCLRNDGSLSANVSYRAFDVSDTETACTGDEAEAGDATCGEGAGELSGLVELQIMKFGTGCGSGGSGSALNMNTIAALASTPRSFLTLAPGECITFGPMYRYAPSEVDGLKGQSDKVTFRLAFNGTTAP